jgi:glutamate-1-semialdehyde 2,1-aminomutase
MTDHVVKRAVYERYSSRTPKSKHFNEFAQRVLPGGDTRSAVYFSPYPTYIDRGEGPIVFDADGNRYLDFHNNYTSLIHGHGHPAVVEAVENQIRKGTLYGSPALCQFELADILCERLPSVERVRFCNSGTEATMMAMRLARAYTNRDVILKMDGGYHGTHDYAEVNITPSAEPGKPPQVRKESKGVPDSILNTMMVVPFNDLDAVEESLSAYNHLIAAIIVEPIMNAGGLVSARDGYLAGLRKLADQYGVLLIFDEVVTFRLTTGGYQLQENVMPDITALGKIIGGGFPVGAVSGKAEIMELFNPTRPGSIKHSGTFNGNNMSMLAGIATLKHYGQIEIDHVNHLGERLRQGISDTFRAQKLKVNVAGRGSLAYIHWTGDEIVTAADAARATRKAGELLTLLHLGLLNQGIWLPHRGELAVSTPMEESDIDHMVAALDEVLVILKPYVEDTAPDLMLE